MTQNTTTLNNMKYMFDTNVFDQLLDGKFCLEDLPNADGFLATCVQVEEILAMPEEDIKRREKLYSKFSEVVTHMEHAAFNWDMHGAGWDEGALSLPDERENIERLFKTMIEGKVKGKVINIDEEIKKALLEGLKDKMHPTFKDYKDALIAACAIRHKAKLVTGDRKFKNAMNKCGFSEIIFFLDTKRLPHANYNT